MRLYKDLSNCMFALPATHGRNSAQRSDGLCQSNYPRELKVCKLHFSKVLVHLASTEHPIAPSLRPIGRQAEPIRKSARSESLFKARASIFRLLHFILQVPYRLWLPVQ
jgi:hypothetical protein